MKKIVIITGASSGMGKSFAQTAKDNIEFDELWAIARSEEKLAALKKELDVPVRAISLDLSDEESYKKLGQMLQDEKPQVQMLVQCSGFGKFCATFDVPVEENLNMVDLNCKAIVALCQIVAPFIPQGGRIVNFASEAAFQPTPYINVYSATKAFVLSYSRALNRELKSKGISVTAVCPFWTNTAFFGRAIDDEKNAVVKKYACMYQPETIVKRAWRDALKRKDVCQYGFTARFQAILAKILPHSLIMSLWQMQQGMK